MANDCAPTAAANIVMYWDSNGYPDMVGSNSWINAANRLGTIMLHTDQSGVLPQYVEPAMKVYIEEHGYTNFGVTRDTSVTFHEVQTIVNNGHPSLLGLSNYTAISPNATGKHMVTLVGFETYYDTSTQKWSQQIIVHDNWDSTGTQVWLKWSNLPVTDVWEISN